MNKKQILDVLLFVICFIIGLMGFFYIEGNYRWIFPFVGGFFAVLFFVLTLHDYRKSDDTNYIKQVENTLITEVTLLSDENHILTIWPLYGKVSMVIGRDVGENQVNINLDGSVYASMVEVEHAALNYCRDSWYVEDLASKNGVRVQKQADGRKYKLSSNQPCKLNSGDILYIGLTRLMIR